MKKFLLVIAMVFHSLTAYQYELSIAAIFQDDARFLEEWIDYHRHVGVEHFYLFNNRSQDNYMAVLQKYINADVVTLVDWPYEYYTAEQWNWVQSESYEEALRMTRGVSRWLALIDTDEFIVPVKRKTIPKVLKDYKGASAIAVNWYMYGTAGVAELLPGERMTYRMLLRAEDSAGEHLLIKSIVQPERTILFNNPHFGQYNPGCSINTDGKPVAGALAPYLVGSVLRINHYWTRDEKFMYEQKIPRRYKMYQQDGQSILDANNRYNVVYDDIIMQKW